MSRKLSAETSRAIPESRQRERMMGPAPREKSVSWSLGPAREMREEAEV